MDNAQFLKHKDLKESPDLNITYSDNDLLVIDSIKEISFMLGFPSTSYFCRYVKKNFGMTPMEIREKNT